MKVKVEQRYRWHISCVDDSWRPYLWIVQLQLQSQGFTVDPLPTAVCSLLTISHSSAGAVTLYLLRYGLPDCLRIESL
jgi:hypothetical protein